MLTVSVDVPTRIIKTTSLGMIALQASMVHAAEVAAGMPFVLKLTLQSYSGLLQTLEVALKDSSGFVTSGQSNAHAFLSCMTHCSLLLMHSSSSIHACSCSQPCEPLR